MTTASREMAWYVVVLTNQMSGEQIEYEVCAGHPTVVQEIALIRAFRERAWRKCVASVPEVIKEKVVA